MPAPSLSNCAASIATRRRFPPPCPGLVLLPALLLFLFAASVALGATDAETIVIERDEIRALNVQRVADILNTVPGVRAGDTSVSICGSSRVRVLLDGRPINDPTSSHGRINFDFITPDAIERIEILPGRGALRYGDDASGGVILITSRAAGRVRGDIRVYGGSQDTVRADGKLRWRKDGWAPQRWLFGVRTEYRHSKRLRFFAEIRNLANISYLYGGGSLAPPRTWLAGIQLSF